VMAFVQALAEELKPAQETKRLEARAEMCLESRR